ncbi:MAG: hypothetical protein NVS4B5_03350 [Vulcanimicrobiaceae bacterium]
MAASIEGYASVPSAMPGEAIDFHVRASASRYAQFSLQIVRRGVSDDVLDTREGVAFVSTSEDDARLAAEGCDWPAVASCRIVVPADWRSGYYVAKLIAAERTAAIPFFVRSASPGSTSRVLVKMSDATAQAYTAWGGRSFYTTPHAPRISYARPYDDMDLFERYQLPFLRWAETSGIALDICSSLDLHRDPRLLEPYRLLVSLGHDEYWSLEMRDQVEAFIASGGNVAFLSANTCYWQVRFDFTGGRRIMICYKETENKPPDPERDDLRRVTVRWFEPPIVRPENRMTGVSYRNGAGWWIDPLVPATRFRGYTVASDGHWVYRGTGLRAGDVFGNGTSVDDTILGYETDAALITPGSRPPTVTGADGTPRDFAVLATADLRDWAAHGQGGAATMGSFQHNGIVFTAGTVNWAGGLTAGGGSSVVDTMTKNILQVLVRERAGLIAMANASFDDWANAVPVGWILDGAGAVSAEATDSDFRNNQARFSDGGRAHLKVDAMRGETWLSHSDLTVDGRKTYGAGCWVKARARGATIRLQTTDTWTDFALAEHSGSGDWEYVFARGSADRDDTSVPARVKIQVSSGVQAVFGDVTVLDASVAEPHS